MLTLNDEFTHVELISFTIGESKKGKLSMFTKDGEELRVASASQPSEDYNVGPYDYQKDAAIQMAANRGIHFVEINQDLILELENLNKENKK